MLKVKQLKAGGGVARSGASCTIAAGLNIDEGTASYYLHLTGGDMKRAFVMYKEDLVWETNNPRGILPLMQRVPIPE